MIVLHGIPNCDTVKKARAWLDARGLAHTFHDFKKQGVPEARLDAWLAGPAGSALVNRKGTTWRKLAPADQPAAGDTAAERALMLREPSVIKRPVVDWGSTTTVGFDPEAWAALATHAGHSG